MKNNRFRSIILFAFIYNCLLITSCTNNSQKPDVSAVDVKLDFRRFEKDLFACDTSHMGSSLFQLKEKYGDFFDLFAFQITSLGSPDSVLMQDRFRQFVSDTNLLAVYRDMEKEFGNDELTKQQLTEAFKYYHYYFPSRTVPQIVTMLSGFSYPVVADSTHLGIGLDMYLGPSYRYYSTIEPPLPQYLRNKMTKEYVVIDALRGWLQSDFLSDDGQYKMLESMISQGRIIYALSKIFPDAPDTLKIGYSSAQLSWCRENESKIWSFFVDQQLLFTTDPNLLMKYVNDGPTTNGFPKESPGNIGQFIGWNIIRSYAENHPDISLSQLMEEKDLQKIFQESKYKPAK